MVVELCCGLGALDCFRRFRNRSRVDRAQGQRDGLDRELPDRNERAQDHSEIDCSLKNAAFLFFGAHEQRVGRFESFGGVSLGFHGVGLVDDRPYCKARATSSRRVLSRCRTALYQSRSDLTSFGSNLGPGIIRSEFGTQKLVQNKGAGEVNSCAFANRTAGLHVVQRAATPAREPAPIGVDIICRAVIPAGVERVPAATARFTRVISFFCPTAALFLGLST